MKQNRENTDIRERDISNPETQRELLFAQDRQLLDAVATFASKIRSFPPDPKCPDIEPRALIVGGFVRDALLGLHPKDTDVEVYGVSLDRLREALHQLFQGTVNEVGRTFCVLKVVVDDGIEFDVSIPRSESKSGAGHKDFEIQGDPAMSIEDAARRRDFTMNSIAADVLEGSVFDPFGGVADIKNRILRITDPERFQDDPLRVYRGIQFVGRYGLHPDEKTTGLMREMIARGDLDHLPKERVMGEIEKLLLESPRPSAGFEYARELGIVETYFPEAHALIGAPQEAEWHPEGDVWIHTMMAMDAAASIIRRKKDEFTHDEQLQVMFGTLCHDFGKPDTTKEIDGRVRSRDHEEEGRAPAERLLSRLTESGELKVIISNLVAEHLKPSALYKEFERGAMNERVYTNNVRRLLKRLLPVTAKILVACSEADVRGRAFPDALTKPFFAGEKMLQTVAQMNLDQAASTTLIMGKDIIDIGNELGMALQGGRRFGYYIKSIEALRDAGQVETREDAIKLVRSWIERDYLSQV